MAVTMKPKAQAEESVCFQVTMVQVRRQLTELNNLIFEFHNCHVLVM